MENLKQALIENIADVLDSEDVQREEILNGVSDPINREKSELHIRMAEAAIDEYERTCDGKKPDARTNTLPIQNVSRWAYFYDNAKPLLIGFCAAMLLSNTYKLIETIIIKIALIVNG